MEEQHAGPIPKKTSPKGHPPKDPTPKETKPKNPKQKKRKLPSKTYADIYAVVRQIPRGQVATYGQVAELAGLLGKPRVVGYALFRVAELAEDIPWHRVVNAKGEVSYSMVRKGSDYLQRSLLEDEGIEFKPNGKLDLEHYRWRPNSAVPSHQTAIRQVNPKAGG